MKYVPNALSISRIVLAPVFLALLMLETFWGMFFALAVFIVAAVSDWLDGQVARRYAVASRLGMFLDPLADKILVLGAFVALAWIVPTVVPWWAVVVIALRDVIVTTLRTIAEARDRPLRTIPMAKLKTGLQLGFVITTMVLLTLERWPWWPALRDVARAVLYSPVIWVFLGLVVVLTVYTGLYYLMHGEPSADPHR